LDVQRVALVGHSFGGWLALLSAAREAPDVCVAAFAAWNVGWAAQRFETHPDERATTLNYFRVTTDPLGGPIRAAADELLQEMTTHASEWDYVLQAKPLKDHALLLIGATRDAPGTGVARHADLARAIHDVGGRQVRVVTYEDDHAFSSHRIGLAQTLTGWLRHDCAKTQTATSLNSTGDSDQDR
jgi:pimeloyl-ACP methyl ester carboxylesterase